MNAIASKSRFRLTAPVPMETDLHQSVADALRVLVMPPAQWTTFPAGHVALAPRHAAKLARLGLKPNWPDVLIVHAGRTFGIELKRHRAGRLSTIRTIRSRTGVSRIVEGQREFFPKLQAAGMLIETCTSIETVLIALAGWGVPLRVHT